MMEGITIISSVEIMGVNPMLLGIACALLLVFIISFIIFHIVASYNIEILLIVLCFLSLCGIVGCKCFWSNRPTGEFIYQVTTQNVNVNEFLSKYEVIDQKGNIYTVVERKDEK